jgi:uncharacterized protein YdeI (YjbR/CyaY-like superfamily)
MPGARPIYFKSPAQFRAWLEKHHASRTELLVGFFRVATGKPSLTWPESVDQALCFGWIDGVRRSVDASRYTIRFSPRKPRSNWSKINLAKIAALRGAGLMHPAGEKAYAAREEQRTGVYSFEQEKPLQLSAAYLKRLKANRKAWDFFQTQAPYYRRTVVFWVMNAKKEETREKRLNTLIADSSRNRRVGVLA